MQEQLDKLYEDYLKTKLDLIFDFDNEALADIPSKRAKIILLKQNDEDEGTYIKYPTIIRQRDNSRLSHQSCYLVDDNGNKISLYYDKIDNFYKGFARVSDYHLWSYIDTTGKQIGDGKTWYKEVNHFEEGYGRVVDSDNKHYFIDKNGKLLNKEGFSFAEDFYGDYAFVKNSDNKWNYINKNGEFVNDEWLEETDVFNGNYRRRFFDGYTIVGKRDKNNSYQGESYRYVNTKGELLNGVWYDVAKEFYGGYACVCKDGLWNFIDTNGNYKNYKYDTGFKYISYYENGYAVVRNEENKYNFVDRIGNLASSICFDTIEAESHTDYYIVGINEKKNLYNPSTDSYVCNEWYDHIYITTDNYIVVTNNGLEAIIDKDGNPLDNTWYDDVSHFESCGFVAVTKNGKMGFVNIFGDKKINEWYDEVQDFYTGYHGFGYAVVGRKVLGVMEWNLIDINGNLVFHEWSLFRPHLHYDNLLTDKYIPIKIGLQTIKLPMYTKQFGKYKINKTIKGYSCISEEDSFEMKKEPIYLYGSRYIICRDNKRLYLFDRVNNTYDELWHNQAINYYNFDKNFIFRDNNVYFIYNNELIDITYYYHQNDLGNKMFKVLDGVKLLSKDDFLIGNEDEIRERAIQAKKENEDYLDAKAREEEKRKIEELKVEKIKRYNELIKFKERILRTITESLKKLQELESELNTKEKIVANHILIDCGEYKEINPLYVEAGLLKHIDLSNVPLKNVKVSGIDYRDTNISFVSDDPWEVYNHDLSNCNFEGVMFSPRTKFTGVNVKGTKFSRNLTGTTIGITEDAFMGAIYDENTTLDGIPLTNIMKKHGR